MVVEIEEALHPMRMLREVGNLAIRQTDRVNKLCSFVDFAWNFHGDIRVCLPSDQFKNELASLVKGSTPVELVHEMWKSLLAYARTFERHRPFKLQMNLLENEYNTSRTMGRAFESDGNNPYRQPESSHPVELALSRAKGAADKYNVESFKEQRKIILKLLEPQYSRIASTSQDLIEEIKSKKMSRSPLDVHRQRLGQAYDRLSLYDYGFLPARVNVHAESFRRELTFNVIAIIFTDYGKNHFDYNYERLPREHASKQMNMPFDIQDVSHKTNSSTFNVMDNTCSDIEGQRVPAR